MSDDLKVYRARKPMSVISILMYLALVVLIVGGIWLAGHNGQKNRQSSASNPNAQSRSTKPITTPR